MITTPSLESIIARRVETHRALWPQDPVLDAWRQNWISTLVEESHHDEFFGIPIYLSITRCAMAQQLIPYSDREESARILHLVAHSQDHEAKLWKKDSLVTAVAYYAGYVPADRYHVLECCNILVRCKFLCENEHYELSMTDEGRAFMRAFGLDEEARK